MVFSTIIYLTIYKRVYELSSWTVRSGQCGLQIERAKLKPQFLLVYSIMLGTITLYLKKKKKILHPYMLWVDEF